jgi:hypothetical protein
LSRVARLFQRNTKAEKTSLFEKLMVLWRIVKPEILISSETLAASPHPAAFARHLLPEGSRLDRSERWIAIAIDS